MQSAGSGKLHGSFAAKGAAQHGNLCPFAINDCNAIIDCIASITIRNLEETTKRKLKVRAALNGHSMEQEARAILDGALREKPLRQKRKSGADLVKRIREIFEPLGGVELESFPRQPMGDPDWLKDWKE